MTSSKELRTAEKEMRKADKQFAAAEKAYEKGNVKSAEKHENRANALAASAQEHAAHAQQVGILATGVTAPRSLHGINHGAFSNTGAWNGGFMNVAPTTLYRGAPIGNYNPTHTYPQDHPYYHNNFSHNGTPLGRYTVGTAYDQDHPYSNSTARLATGTGLTAAAIPLTSGLTSGTPLATTGLTTAGAPLTSGLTSGLLAHHGTYSDGIWNGGFMNTSPSTMYEGHTIGNFDPFYSYPTGHPYHHSNYQYNGQALGPYQAGTNYPVGHPYHGIGSGLGSGLGGALLGTGAGLGVSPFGAHHNTGGFYDVAPTTLYQGQAIGNYNPLTSYAEGHPYHHSNFKYNGQPLGPYQVGTTYPQGHPYYGFGSTGSGLTSGLGSGLGSGLATGLTSTTSPFGTYHNTGGFYNVAPTTLYQGKPIGNYNPMTSYAHDHPYYHSNFQYNGQPLGPYQAGTTYPQGHPYYGFGSTGSGLTSGLGSGLTSGLGSGLTSGLGSGLTSGLGSGLTSPFGAYHNNGGFFNVAPTTLYQGQAIGNYNPLTSYPQGHPYHHSNFQYNGQPLGPYQSGTVYPQGHPYYGLGSTGLTSGLGSGLASGLGSGLGSGLASGLGSGLISPFGAHHNTGGFYNVAPTTLYQGQAIGNYDPLTSYPQGHPYHHSNFSYNGQPLGPYQAGTTYPQGHPYYGFGSSGLNSGLGLGQTSPLGQYHGTGGFMNVSPTTVYNGQPIGNYNPLTSYPQDHPYHHSRFTYQGQPLGAYNPSTVYTQGHPYYGLGSGSGLSSGLSALSLGGVSPFGQYHNNGGFYNVSPTTVYQGQPIGNYNPLTAYPQGHPYHHSNFHYQGQPLQAYQSGVVYPQDHPYYGFGDISRGLTATTATPTVISHTYVPYVSPFGQNHGTWVNGQWVGGLFNVAPSTMYNGRAIGNYDPLFDYPEDHPYHHRHHSYNGSPLERFTAGTQYPQGHPFYGQGLNTSTGGINTGLAGGLGSGLGLGSGVGLGSVLGSGIGGGLGSGLGSTFGPHHGSFANGKWNGGFMNVDPIVAYNGKPIGDYDPLYDYPADHPYHHSNFHYNNQPLGRFQRGTQYPQGHPYYGIL